jgi:hypothetical protein
MTRVLCTIKPHGIYFDCENHSNDNEMCARVSTLCNVLVVAAMENGTRPQVYKDGHVLIDIPGEPSKELESAFAYVYKVFAVLEDQFPDGIKLYT